MLARFLISVGLISLLAMTSCVTTTDSEVTSETNQKNSAKSAKKPGADDKQAALSYVMRLSKPENPFRPEDKAFIQGFKKLPLNKVEEAAVVVGTFRRILKNNEDLTSGTLEAHEPAPETQSLELAFKKYRIDAVAALSDNVALKNHDIYKQALEATELSGDTAEFKEKIRQLVFREAGKWGSLVPPKLEAPATDVKEQTIEQPTADSPAPEAAPLSPGDLARGDAILAQAEKFAEDGAYKKAIDALAQIPATDPIFDSAHEKARRYENLAVQELRQKAAQAYQNSMPSGDLRTKASYLESARKILESAISDYPEAEQISVVKQNLAVIADDLKKLRAQLGDGKAGESHNANETESL